MSSHEPPNAYAGLKEVDWNCLLAHYSGNHPDGRRILASAMKMVYHRVPLLYIERKQSTRGRIGGVEKVTCGFCGVSHKTLQNVAEHMISTHLMLDLWHCDLENCGTTCRRKWDLKRHREVQHNVVEPTTRKSKKRDHEAEATAVSHSNVPSSPSSAFLSVAGPSRNGRSRSRSGSRSPYSTPSHRHIALASEDGSCDNVRRGGNDAGVSSHDRPEVRGRQPTLEGLHTRRDIPQLVIPNPATPPTVRESSPTNNPFAWGYQDPSRLSPCGPRMGHGLPTQPGLLEQDESFPTQSCTNTSPAGPYLALGDLELFQFTSAGNIDLSPSTSPPPVQAYPMNAEPPSQPDFVHLPHHLHPRHVLTPTGGSPHCFQASSPPMSPLNVAWTPLPVHDDIDDPQPTFDLGNLTSEDIFHLWQASGPGSNAFGLSPSPNGSFGTDGFQFVGYNSPSANTPSSSTLLEGALRRLLSKESCTGILLRYGLTHPRIVGQSSLGLYSLGETPETYMPWSGGHIPCTRGVPCRAVTFQS